MNRNFITLGQVRKSQETLALPHDGNPLISTTCNFVFEITMSSCHIFLTTDGVFMYECCLIFLYQFQFYCSYFDKNQFIKGFFEFSLFCI